MDYKNALLSLGFTNSIFSVRCLLKLFEAFSVMSPYSLGYYYATPTRSGAQQHGIKADSKHCTFEQKKLSSMK